MHPESDQNFYGYPDPSFALSRLTQCFDEASGLILGDPALCSAPERVIGCTEVSTESNFHYPDPSLGLLPAEEEVMAEELEEELELAFA